MSVTQNNAGAIIAEHYQKTCDLTDQAREQRDRTFLYLLLTLGAATLFTVDANSSTSLLTNGIAKVLEKPELAESLKGSLLLKNVQTLLLAIGLYLLSGLYNRTVTVLRNYQYLGALEREIRAQLGLHEKDFSFTREGEFYWRTRTPVLKRNRQIFALFLATLLLISFVTRVYSDVLNRDYIIGLPDLALGLASLYYLWGYHNVSRDMDRAAQDSKAK